MTSRSWVGLALGAAATVLGLGAGLWLGILVAQLLPGNVYDSGLLVAAYLLVLFLEFGMGAAGLYLGYRLYFRLSR